MDYKTAAEPRGMTKDKIPVFCAYDELMEVGRLKPNPMNPNQHNTRQIAMLGDIIASTGWRAPVTVSKRSGLIVKGHGRRMAAISKGLKYVPVEYQEYASEAEEHADLLADNRIAELAEIDTRQLMDIIDTMDTGEVPLELSGYDSEDLAAIISALEGDEDAVDDGADALPEEQDGELPPASKLGDLWMLGRHRLLCGSATDDAEIDRLMDGKKAQMVHTDPPYGVSFVGSGRGANKFGMIMNDDLTHDELVKDLLYPAFMNYVRHTDDDAAFYIWHSSNAHRDFQDAMMAAGIVEKQIITWVKNNFVIGHNDYHWITEPCAYAEKVNNRCHYYGDRSQTTAWAVTSRDLDGMATALAGGLVVTDGQGNKLMLSDKPPKNKKLRYIRLTKDRPLYVFSGEANTTAWQVAKESKAVHPTEKPVELPIRAITNSSQPCDIVLDFFGGSGSTLIAAEMLGRTCYTVELDPKYVDVIVRRYVEHAGGSRAVRCIRDGKEYSFEDIFSGYGFSDEPADDTGDAQDEQ